MIYYYAIVGMFCSLVAALLTNKWLVLANAFAAGWAFCMMAREAEKYEPKD